MFQFAERNEELIGTDQKTHKILIEQIFLPRNKDR
jgi:hypothetical protein